MVVGDAAAARVAEHCTVAQALRYVPHFSYHALGIGGGVIFLIESSTFGAHHIEQDAESRAITRFVHVFGPVLSAERPRFFIAVVVAPILIIYEDNVHSHRCW